MKTGFFTITLLFLVNYLFAQTYSNGSDIIGARPSSVYSIFGNTNNQNGAFIEMWGNNSGRPGEITFVSGLGNSSPGITFHTKTATGYYNSTILHRNGTFEQISQTGKKTWLGASGQAAISFVPNIGNSWFHIHHTHNNSLQFSHGGNPGDNPMMTINNDGQVRIGHEQAVGTHKDYKLSVDGKLLTKSVYVTADVDANWWPDFVFKKDYELTPLLEIESFIKKEGHLKGIPTTEQIMENGIDVAQMNASLLQKVEELTLYMIEMKKELNSLKKNQLNNK